MWKIIFPNFQSMLHSRGAHCTVGQQSLHGSKITDQMLRCEETSITILEIRSCSCSISTWCLHDLRRNLRLYASHSIGTVTKAISKSLIGHYKNIKHFHWFTLDLNSSLSGNVTYTSVDGIMISRLALCLQIIG